MTDLQLHAKRSEFNDLYNSDDVCFNHILLFKANEQEYLTDLHDTYRRRCLYRDSVQTPNAVVKAYCCHLRTE